MSQIIFKSKEHRDFFLEMMSKCKVNDCYHRAFFYVMGIAGETRANINQMFDFKQDCIEPEGMYGGWQTSGTVKVCHLAFNLWNNYVERALRQKIYFAVSSPRILWRGLRLDTQNIAGNFIRPKSRTTIHAKGTTMPRKQGRNEERNSL